MKIDLTEQQKKDAKSGEVKHLVYTNPTFLLMPFNVEFMTFFKSRIGSNEVSFLKNMSNYYLQTDYLKHKQPIDDEKALILMDGHSMAEISHTVSTKFEAYFNIASLSLFYDSEYWVKLLYNSFNKVEYHFLDVTYDEYIKLHKITKSKNSVLAEEMYEEHTANIKDIVEELRVLSSYKMGDERVH